MNGENENYALYGEQRLRKQKKITMITSNVTFVTLSHQFNLYCKWSSKWNTGSFLMLTSPINQHIKVLIVKGCSFCPLLNNGSAVFWFGLGKHHVCIFRELSCFMFYYLPVDFRETSQWRNVVSFNIGFNVPSKIYTDTSPCNVSNPKRFLLFHILVI